MRRVYKYGTGRDVPEGAVYLTTIVEVEEDENGMCRRWVWHYFLVDTYGAA